MRVNDFTLTVSPADLFIRKDRRPDDDREVRDDDREVRDDNRRLTDNLEAFDRPELLKEEGTHD